MRRIGAKTRGLITAALLLLSLSLTGAFAPAAQALDNPRQGEWYLDAMHLPQTWQSANGTGVTVAVIGSGVNADHPDLTGQVLPGRDYSGLPGNENVDSMSEGTKVASIIAGSGKSFNGKGVMGFAPGAKILPLKVNNTTDVGTASSPGTEISSDQLLVQVDQAIDYAVSRDAKVIDISLALLRQSITARGVRNLQDAVDRAISHGTLVVAPAGDNGQQGNDVTYPANTAGVAGIAAFNQQGGATNESEHDKYIALAGPGVDVIGACAEPSGYCTTHGTSDAAAGVAAMGAILFSQHPTWTGNQVLRVLINSAFKPNDGSSHSEYIGFGNVSVSRAVKYTGDPGAADVNPLVDAGINVTGPPNAFMPEPDVPTPSAVSSSAPSTPSRPLTSSSDPDGISILVAAAVVDAAVVAGLITHLVVRKRRRTPSPTLKRPTRPIPSEELHRSPDIPPSPYQTPATPPQNEPG
ncbi:S8 family serine peptidase [Kitasatospora sp. RB6PN24]|uniref:S8 family peptidase n=1 Tax=Kitasatospora humi TaxID=2893891 RepID=UPI001E4D744A|nr:S8 family serine peptidase [Kitasatospora humi]MCC9306843.1 S8 family serine peptidase [Kitasatospora humi]